MEIPKDYIEFLHWIKETTEAFWSKRTKEKPEELLPDEWIRGAKWIGLTEEEIDRIEEKYQVKFTVEHRAFLNILHTIDKKEPREHYDENDKLIYVYKSFFHNWLIDDDELEYRLRWSYETILDDLLNQSWWNFLGKEPQSNEGKKIIFTEQFQVAPKLIPIYGHRFVISEPQNVDNPVLSVYGSDIIIYGWNMRHYLLSELKMHLDLMFWEYDEEDDCYCLETKKELQDIHDYEYRLGRVLNIPFWEEFIS